MIDKNVIIIGAFHEIIELCEECNVNVIGLIDNQLKDNYWGYKILGTDENAKKLFKIYSKIPIIISPDAPAKRAELAETYSRLGFKFYNIISPRAFISRSAKLGFGIIAQNGVNISSNVRIGNFVKLNSYANIMHDTEISDYATIAPNAVLLGRVQVGEKAYIGANATILPELQIANGSIIGAGSVITKSTDINKVYAGVPGIQLSK